MLCGGQQQWSGKHSMELFVYANMSDVRRKRRKELTLGIELQCQKSEWFVRLQTELVALFVTRDNIDCVFHDRYGLCSLNEAVVEGVV